MKIKFCITSFLLFVLVSVLPAQIIFNSKVDSVINLVSSASIANFNKDLSGEQPVTIGGNVYRIYSRKYDSPMNPVAAQYIHEKFQGFGLETRYQYNSSTNINVIGKKTGTKYPNKYFIICAHYDNVTSMPSDTVYGADDNASGMCAVLESARLLANMQFDYTVYFIGFDEEEIGLYGSRAYSDSAFARGDSIMGVLNLDMIGYDGNNESKFNAIVNPQSVELADDFIRVNLLYNIGLIPVKSVNGNSSGSDHWYFWQRGYKAFFGIENNFNPFYHSINDRYDKINQAYFTKVIKNSIGTLISWGKGLKSYIDHTQIYSSADTSAKVAAFKVTAPFKIALNINSPRLYYRINSGAYQYVNAYYSSGDSLKFIIPGQPPATKISYYLAFQDSSGTVCVTSPAGGNGINPPGTTPPSAPYVYYVFSSGSACTVSPPKSIPDLVVLQDTIKVNTLGKVSDIKVNLNINHPDDGELLLMLRSPSNNQITLSSYNGSGGANYTNTTFNDSAAVSIMNGTPPFTGNYKPQNSFSNIINNDLNGNWILRIYDNKTGNQGSLINWCIIFKYYIPVSVNEFNSLVSFELKQNYPNPFNPVTKIGFNLDKNDYVTLKIFDQLGREVQTLISDNLTQGFYECTWNAKNFPSGVYFYKLEMGNRSLTKRMLLTK